VKIDLERVQYWVGQGAQTTDRVARFLEAAGVKPKAERANLKAGQPGKAAVERAKTRADKAAAAAAAPVVTETPAPAEAEVAAEVEAPVEVVAETESPAETEAAAPAEAETETPVAE
jgi:small subunit ribosomal protein S16